LYKAPWKKLRNGKTSGKKAVGPKLAGYSRREKPFCTSKESPAGGLGEEHALTIRQRIAELLKQGEYTARDLSRLLSIKEKEVYDHLEHEQRSLGSKVNVIAHPPRCLDCGFIFLKRKRFTSPSRCPQCRSESITTPIYGVIETGEAKKTSRAKAEAGDRFSD
jgi:transcriptional regulator